MVWDHKLKVGDVVVGYTMQKCLTIVHQTNISQNTLQTGMGCWRLCIPLNNITPYRSNSQQFDPTKEKQSLVSCCSAKLIDLFEILI